MFSSSLLELLIVLALAAGVSAWLVPVLALPPTPVVAKCAITMTSAQRSHDERYWFGEQGEAYCAEA